MGAFKNSLLLKTALPPASAGALLLEHTERCLDLPTLDHDNLELQFALMSPNDLAFSAEYTATLRAASKGLDTPRQVAFD